ncbi:polysaccharide deacetylase family protein [Wenyingzhuangia sp. IMCC45467]
MIFFKNKISLYSIFLFFTLSAFGQQTHAVFSVAKYKDNKQAAISYTFDDGLQEHYTLIYPEFKKLGFKATFWINGNTINEGELGKREKPRLTWNEIKEISSQGHEISNHGWTHKKLTQCTPDEMQFEIVHNDSVIEAKVGKRPTTFCYPNNSMNKEVIKAASKNRVGTRTEQFQMGRKSTSEILSNKIDTILKNKEWCVAMIHGITYGYDAFKKDSILWNHLREVKLLEDKIWVGTFHDISAYTQEQKKIELDIVTKRKKWIITPKISLDKHLFNTPLTMVVDKNQIAHFTVEQNGEKLKTITKNNQILFDFDPNGDKIKIKEIKL